MQTVKITEGVYVHVITTGKFKTMAMALLLRTPLSRENATKTALLANVLKSGSENYETRQEIKEYTEKMYGSVFDVTILKKGEEHILQAFIEIVNEDVFDGENLLDQGMDFLNEIIFLPLVKKGGFHKPYVEREKEALRQTIRNKVNDKKEYALFRCIEEMCKEEPFGVSGDGYEEDLESIDERNLYDHYQYVIEKATIDFALVGNYQPKEVKQKFEKYFSIKERTEIDLKLASVKPNQVKDITEEMDIVQSKLCIGIRSGLPNTGLPYFSLLAFNSLLGGGSHSKLFQNVREKENLCYYIHSVHYKFKSILFIQAGIEGDKLEKTVNLIQSALEDLKEKRFGEEDLNNAKISVSKQFEGIKDNISALLDFYISAYMLGDTLTIDGANEIIQKISFEDIVCAAKSTTVDTIYFLKGRGM